MAGHSKANTVSIVNWHRPQVEFSTFIVGSSKDRFVIQQALLCARSPYFRKQDDRYFELPKTEVAVFGYFQHFLFTGNLDYANGIPEYDMLLGIWKLGVRFHFAELCSAALDAIDIRHKTTRTLPRVDIHVAAFKITEKGSTLRSMFVEWIKAHRILLSQEIQATDPKAMQELLGELVNYDRPVAVAHSIHQVEDSYTGRNLPTDRILSHTPARERNGNSTPSIKKTPSAKPSSVKVDEPVSGRKRKLTTPRSSQSAHRREQKGGSTAFSPGSTNTTDNTAVIKKKDDELPPDQMIRDLAKEMPEPSQTDRPPLGTHQEQMEFCQKVLHLMLSDSGWWSKVNMPFMYPVDTDHDGAPDYYKIIERPMSLSEVETKLNNDRYMGINQFAEDVRQIFKNCYQYWESNDEVFHLCKLVEKAFNQEWACVTV